MQPIRKYLIDYLRSKSLTDVVNENANILRNVTIDSIIVDESFLQRFQDDDVLVEAYVNKRIPGTKGKTYQVHLPYGEQKPGHLKHIHIYAKNGKELYSVNNDGTAHDGYHGVQIPDDEANFFRSKGFAIPDSNIIECLSFPRVTLLRENKENKSEGFVLKVADLKRFIYRLEVICSKARKFKLVVLDSKCHDTSHVYMNQECLLEGQSEFISKLFDTCLSELLELPNCDNQKDDTCSLQSDVSKLCIFWN